MIRVENIHKAFGTNEVLKGVNLEVQHGEVVVVIGPSGSGKTTLLRCINFLETADKGTITINDKTVDAHKASRKDILDIRRRTAMVFQHYNLFKNKTALENVTEGLTQVKKLSKQDAETIARTQLDRMGLSDKYDSYPSQLSGGQQQRVGIARALALDPEVILFDEPTSALDPELVSEVLRSMCEVAKEGRTMIVVTHEISFARALADRVIFMEGGYIVESGPPEQVLADPQEPRTREFLKLLDSNTVDYII